MVITSADLAGEGAAGVVPVVGGTVENTASARSRADRARGGVGRAGADEGGRALTWGAGIGVSRARSSAFAKRFSHTKSSGGSWIASRGTFRIVVAIVDRVARRSAGSGIVGVIGTRRGDGAPTGATLAAVVTTTGADRVAPLVSRVLRAA